MLAETRAALADFMERSGKSQRQKVGGQAVLGRQ